MFAITTLTIVTCSLLQLQVCSVEGVTVLQKRGWLKDRSPDTQNQDRANYDIQINVEVINKGVSGYTFKEPDNPSALEYENRGKLQDSYDANPKSFPKYSTKQSSEEVYDTDTNSQNETVKIYFSPNDINSLLADPPPHEEVAKMARFIVRESNWTSMATISVRNPIKGYPFANVFSMSDGPVGKSTGVPYMYLTPLEMSVIDLNEDNRASLTMSLAQSDYCWKNGYDPEDPRCAHVILTGNILQISNKTSEYAFAKTALFTRHPEMTEWPYGHGWFFGKMNITNILVLDYFGGANTVSTEDYFNVK